MRKQQNPKLTSEKEKRNKINSGIPTTKNYVNIILKHCGTSTEREHSMRQNLETGPRYIWEFSIQ